MPHLEFVENKKTGIKSFHRHLWMTRLYLGFTEENTDFCRTFRKFSKNGTVGLDFDETRGRLIYGPSRSSAGLDFDIRRIHLGVETQI